MVFGDFGTFWDFLALFGLFGTFGGRVLFSLSGLLLEIVKILRTSILKMDVLDPKLKILGLKVTF